MLELYYKYLQPKTFRKIKNKSINFNENLITSLSKLQDTVLKGTPTKLKKLLVTKNISSLHGLIFSPHSIVSPRRAIKTYTSFYATKVKWWYFFKEFPRSPVYHDRVTGPQIGKADVNEIGAGSNFSDSYDSFFPNTNLIGKLKTFNGYQIASISLNQYVIPRIDPGKKYNEFRQVGIALVDVGGKITERYSASDMEIISNSKFNIFDKAKYLGKTYIRSQFKLLKSISKKENGFFYKDPPDIFYSYKQSLCSDVEQGLVHDTYQSIFYGNYLKEFDKYYIPKLKIDAIASKTGKYYNSNLANYGFIKGKTHPVNFGRAHPLSINHLLNYNRSKRSYTHTLDNLNNIQSSIEKATCYITIFKLLLIIYFKLFSPSFKFVKNFQIEVFKKIIKIVWFTFQKFIKVTSPKIKYKNWIRLDKSARWFQKRVRFPHKPLATHHYHLMRWKVPFEAFDNKMPKPLRLLTGYINHDFKIAKFNVHSYAPLFAHHKKLTKAFFFKHNPDFKYNRWIKRIINPYYQKKYLQRRKRRFKAKFKLSKFKVSSNITSRFKKKVNNKKKLNQKEYLQLLFTHLKRKQRIIKFNNEKKKKAAYKKIRI